MTIGTMSRRRGAAAATSLATMVLVGGLTGCAGDAHSAVAAAPGCPAPEVTTTPPQGLVGEAVLVAGSGFLDGCEEGSEPLGPQEVRWVQSGAEKILGAVAPNAAGSVSATITIPAEATAGPAVIEIGEGSTEFTVTE
jgi:hypothetical protein